MWEGIGGVFVGAVLGYWFSRRAQFDADRQQALGILLVLQHDVARGTERFRTYLDDKIDSPAYRLPTATWQASFAFLAGSKSISAAEIPPLARFFELAAEMNYCLDQIMASDMGSSKGSAEVDRARLKATKALEAKGENLSLAKRAQDAVDAAVARARASKFWRLY